MNFPESFHNFKIRLDSELEAYFSKRIREISKEDLLVAEMLSHSRDIAIAGGKRLRPFLAYQAYCEFGGKDRRSMMRAAVGLELLHLFFLTHDDIMDNGDFRHGIATLHSAYSKRIRKSADKEKKVHYGKSIAIAGGDMLFSLANEALLGCGLAEKQTVQMAMHLQKIVSSTITGQIQDISLENEYKPKEEAVIKMYMNKTAIYTFEGPLHFGAYAAGIKDRKIFSVLTEYARSIGVAFQIQDDLIGLFSKENKTGKPAISDIKEGKRTLLVIKAFEKADGKQKKTLERFLGKRDLSMKEAVQFRDIIVNTGSRAYSEGMVTALIANAKKSVVKIKDNEGLKIFLSDIADYLERREI
jgi:geranylgeranyl diphosphate synthase type I